MGDTDEEGLPDDECVTDTVIERLGETVADVVWLDEEVEQFDDDVEAVTEPDEDAQTVTLTDSDEETVKLDELVTVGEAVTE